MKRVFRSCSRASGTHSKLRSLQEHIIKHTTPRGGDDLYKPRDAVKNMMSDNIPVINKRYNDCESLLRDTGQQ